MDISKKVKIIFILVLVFCGVDFSQEEQVKADKQLREQILDVYQSGGEQGLLDFVKKEKDKISNEFIVDFAKSGFKERKEEWLKACKIMAEERKDEKPLADVLYQTGRYFSLIADFYKAADYFDKAFSIYLKLNDPVGQGNVYLRKRRIYYYTGDNSKAIEMYDKGLPFFEKAGDPVGQGNVYGSKGGVYVRINEFSRALEMYNKALTFFEKAGELIGQSAVYMAKGDIYRSTGDHSRALEMFNKALTFFEKAGTLVHESYTLFGKAKALVKLRKRNEALDLFEKAIANQEKVRTKTTFKEMQKTFMESFYKQYKETVMFMLENKHYDKGFKYAESMMARVFLDQMAEGLVRLDKGLTTDLKQKRDKLVAKLSRLSKEMHQTAAKEEEKKLQKLKEEYRKAEI